MSNSYEEVMRPLFLRLGGDENQLCMDFPTVVELPKSQTLQSICEVVAENINTVGSAHCASTLKLENKLLSLI